MVAFSVSCPSAVPCPSAGSCLTTASCSGSARSAAGATADAALPTAVVAEAGPSVAVARDGAAARHALGSRDRERCAGLPTAGARRDFRAGRLAARRAVAGLVAGSGPVEGVKVSLAHQAGRGLAAAVAPGAVVGVDLEREDAVAPREIRYFLTVRERAAWRVLDPTELWTLAEALWKLLRLSRTVPFHALEVVPGPADGVVHVRYSGRSFRARYRIVRPWPGWVGSVVWRRGGG